MSYEADQVIVGNRQWSADCADCLDWLRALPTASVSLVFFSPPYSSQRTYGIGFKREGQAWVDWLRPIVVESARVSAGLVVVNVASPVRGWKYQPEIEWLVSDLTRLDGLVCGPSPYAWVKSQNHEEADGNGIPGSGGAKYQRRDWEPLYAFACPDRLPDTRPQLWSDNTAFGHAPKWGPGGDPSHRQKDGTRVNAPGSTRRAGREYKAVKRYERKHTKRMKGLNHESGETLEEQTYRPPKISNPGNVIRAAVGGGKMGHSKAHESEAPMSLAVAERFVCWFVPHGGIVADPFLGSGTTIHAAVTHGRRGIGCDLRQSQVDICCRRLSAVTPPLPGMAA